MAQLKNAVADNIKRLRKSRDVSAAELAMRIGVSQSTVSDWETAKKMPRAGAVESLAEYFGVLKSDILSDMSEAERANLPASTEIIDLEALLHSPIRIVWKDIMLDRNTKALISRLTDAAIGGEKDE